MSAVLEARAVITAEDRTGKAFDSLKARIAAITKQAEVIDRALGTVGAVAKNVDAVAAPAERAASALARMGEAGRAVSGVASAIGTVERASAGMATSLGRSSGAVQKLSGELSEARAKLAAITDFKGANRALDETALAFRRGQQEVRRLQAEIAGMENPTKSMHGALASAQASSAGAAEAFRLQGVAAREARGALEQLGVPVNRLRSEEEQLTAAIERTADALRQQVGAEREAAAAAERTASAERRAGEISAQAAARAARAHAREVAEREAEIRHHGAMNFLTMGAAGIVSAHSVFEGISETAHAGAEYNHEIIGLQNAGRTPDEIAAIEKRSSEVVGRLPTASYLENMKVIAETTGAFGSIEHAMEHLEFMQRTMSVLKAAGGEHIRGGVGDVGRALAKTFEERMTRPEEFEKEAAAMIPAMVASGGVFNPEQLYMFAQQAKSSLPNYSMRFLSRIAPSLITAQGGEQAGTAANAFTNVIMGKARDAKQAAEWIKYGLLDPTKLVPGSKGPVGWQAGAVKNTDLALQDPLRWAEEVALPAMQAKGVKIEDRLELAKALGTMFRNLMSNQFANEMMQAASRARLHKDEGLYGQVGTDREIYERNRKDPTVQALALKAALENLMVTLANPLMSRAGLTMNTVASGLDSLANTMKEHPSLAASAGVMAAGGALAGAGWLSYQFMNGFGLGASATALEVAAGEQTGAAGALSAAAARLGAAGIEHGFENALPGVGGKLGRSAEHVVVREGEHLAEGAAEGVAEAAIGSKVVSAIEGGLKGGLKVEGMEIAAAGGLEIAAAAGITLTAGSVAFLGLTAAAIVAGLSASTPPKHRASDEPNFGRPFAPVPGLDLNDPRYRAPEDRTPEEKDQLKPWENRNKGAHPRGSLPAYRDTDHPGHWVDGPHGTKHWAVDDDRPMKGIPFFASPLIGPDGLPSVGTAAGLPPDPLDRRTWAHIDGGTPVLPPEPSLPDVAPLPPVRPGSGIERRTLGAYIDFARPQAEAGDMPLPGRRGDGPVPVSIVGMPPAARDPWLDGDREGIEERSRRGAAMFRADHESAVAPHMMHEPDVAPHADEAHDTALHVDASQADTASAKVKEVQDHMAALNGVTAGLKIDMGPVDEAIRKLTQLRALAAGAGGGTSGSVGTSYPQTAPTGRQGGPR